MVKNIGQAAKNEFLTAYRRRLSGGGGHGGTGGGALGVNFFHPAAHFGGHYLAVYQVDGQLMAVHEIDCFDTGTPGAAMVDEQFMQEISTATRGIKIGSDECMDAWRAVFQAHNVI
jgi:hypothetical protein